MAEGPPHNPPTKDDWIMHIGTELKETPPISSSWSICRVPTGLRSVNEDAYTPRAVSIGPFHHGDKKLKPMEDYKRLFLGFLFQRTQKPEEEILKDCCNTILALDKDVRACYAEPIDFDKYKLAKILLYDAGFVLELFLKFCRRGPDNPIFIPTWMWVSLHRDLALLENQIPLFVLNSVFNIIVSHVGGAALPRLEVLALAFFVDSASNLSVEVVFNEKRSKEGNHLLHLLHNCYLPSNPLNSTRDGSKWIPCATSLRQAGVAFQKNETNDLFNLKFEDGIFKIPPLVIQDRTDSLFRNLIAFEVCQRHSERHVTSYVLLMDMLLDTEDDAKLLQEKGIIESRLGWAGDVSNMFNNLGKHVSYAEFHYAGLCEKVDAYANSRWHRYIAALRRDYFKNPWSFISFLAAVILLHLTLLQTMFSVLSYIFKS